MLHNNKILILAPHTDDGELGCGASIAKYLEEGKHITYVAFSTCSQSLPKDKPGDTLATECRAATKALGIQEVILFDFEVRRLLFHRQEILEELIRLNKTLQPDAVFIPAKNDVHQDHQVVYAEGIRAFKNCNVLGYELPWNNFEFAPTYFEKLTVDHINTKQNALQQYQSQQHRNYMQFNFTQALATVRGMQCNAALAEAFEVYRLTS